ncbi:hypothetical protein DXX92_05760 [Thalassotalea euphylliae]|uniref:Uncharacterized protein n=1 Tax=Thalassotalea euphylliae TaxID=1655234 RepID=A0A3E0UDF4_9GAMM|nr:hypothetical protein DXX92_05760 [Thalassotalea euphylliae]
MYGGSLNYKNEDNLEAVFAYKRENHFYIDKVNIDLNSLIISSNTNILDSPLELYRPIIFESHDRTLLMFNEAAYWINYFDWQASQTIIKLE